VFESPFNGSQVAGPIVDDGNHGTYTLTSFATLVAAH
jgi:hypothetical protein